MAEDIAPEGEAVVAHAFDGTDVKFVDWDTIEAIKDALEALRGALASVGTDTLVIS